MDFPKTREEKSVSESLDWVVLVTGIEMVLISKGAFSIAKDIFFEAVEAYQRGFQVTSSTPNS